MIKKLLNQCRFYFLIFLFSLKIIDGWLGFFRIIGFYLIVILVISDRLSEGTFISFIGFLFFN